MFGPYELLILAIATSIPAGMLYFLRQVRPEQ